MPKLPQLKRIRESQFISQQELANRAQVDKGTIIDLEAGRRDARFVTVRKLAEALKVEPGELARE